MRKRVPFIAILMGPVRSISSTFIRRFKHDWATAFLRHGPVVQWWENLNDGVYTVPGFLLVPATGAAARDVGYRPGAEVSWQIDLHAYPRADYGIFHAGEFLKQASPGRNISYTEF